jgi:hypothetical protein
LHTEHKPVNDNATVTSYIVERTRKLAVVNEFPIGAITRGSAGEELAALSAMKAAGAVAISVWRRHARGRQFGSLGPARDSGGLRGRDGGAGPGAGAANRRATTWPTFPRATQ